MLTWRADGLQPLQTTSALPAQGYTRAAWQHLPAGEHPVPPAGASHTHFEPTGLIAQPLLTHRATCMEFNVQLLSLV